MTNRLTKASRTTVIPGIPYQPAVPARCYTTSYNTTVYSELGTILNPKYNNKGKVVLTPAQTKLLKNANYIQAVTVYVSGGAGGGLQAIIPAAIFYYTYTIPTVQTVCVPGVPEVKGKPPTYIVDNQRGWTSGGRSKIVMAGDLVAEFMVARVPTGVVCGLASGNASSDIGAIEHGAYASVGQLSIIESGVVVTTVPGVSFDTSPLIRISRSGSQITYTVGNWQYQSAKASTGSKFLQASLYVAGDYVDNPRLFTAANLAGKGVAGVISFENPELLFGRAKLGVQGRGTVETAALSLSLFGAASVGARATADIGAFISMQGNIGVGLVGLDRPQSTGAARFGFVAAGSDRAYAQGKAVLPALTVNAYGGFPTVNVGGGQATIAIYAQGDSKTGGIGGGSIPLPALLLRGSEGVYGSGSLMLPAFFGQGISAPFTTEITSATRLGLGDSYVFQPTVFMSISDGMQVGDTVDLLLVFQEDLAEHLGIGDNASATFLLELLISSGLNIGNDMAQARQDLAQYATNIATGAVTRYSGFGFSSFCRVGMDLYATRKDGLYKIGGATDNGELLSCLIDFAGDDQGTPRTKRLENIFLGLTTDGKPLARLKADDGREVKYRLIQRDSSEARIDTAKGVSSRYWHLRLEIEDATYAEIDNIEWVAATGTRRTKR
jgi:hypothetical protein